MIFTTRKPDGSTEQRQHVEYSLKKLDGVVLAYSVRGNRLLGRFTCENVARRILSGMTENAAPK